MKWKEVSSDLLGVDGRRMDCNPYMSGAIEAKLRLDSLSVPKEPLSVLTGGLAGLVNAGRIKRIWVESAEFGRPFLSSTDILQADISRLRFISHRAVAENPRLTIQRGWTLITRAGTIGRMAYARDDMHELACTEDVLRVIPSSMVPSGYLYAYLCSKFGLPLVLAGTYGAIIQHIEPEHIADLPVPRLGPVEDRAHALVEEASRLRTRAAETLATAVRELEERAGLSPLGAPASPTPYSTGEVSSHAIAGRFDAFFHSPYARLAETALRESTAGTTTVRELATAIIEPNRFKRIRVDDPEFGIKFLGTASLMRSEPVEMYLLPKSQRGIQDYIVSERTVLIPRSGQLSGIIGRAVLPYGDILGAAVSEDAIRVHCADAATAGFLFVALTSEYGLRQLKARAYGSSIPHLDVHQIGCVRVPSFDRAPRVRLGARGAEVAALRDEAIHKERQAKRLVERAIEEAS